MALLPRDRDAPGQFADLDGLDDLEVGDVDDRNVVRYAVGGQEILLVGRERHVPDALSDQKVFSNVVGYGVDHRDAIGWTERHEGGLAVTGNADPDRLDGFLPQPRYLEGDLLHHLVPAWIYHAYGSADFGRDPELE